MCTRTDSKLCPLADSVVSLCVRARTFVCVCEGSGEARRIVAAGEAAEMEGGREGHVPRVRQTQRGLSRVEEKGWGGGEVEGIGRGGAGQEEHGLALADIMVRLNDR